MARPVATALSARDVTKSLEASDGRPFLVLDGISLEVPAGAFVAVIGPSGCGKSTLLRLLDRLIAADSGVITTSDGASGITAFVFQQPRLLGWRTVRQNVALALPKLSRAESEARIARLLHLVDLEAFSETYPLRLSGGMQQRVGLARALASDPTLLLMDEPFSNLDQLTAAHLRDELLRLWETLRCTVVFVTHDLAEATLLADRVYVLSPRPARVVAEIVVDAPRPRNLTDPTVIDIHERIRNALAALDIPVRAALTDEQIDD